jgi:hypothetical protein
VNPDDPDERRLEEINIQAPTPVQQPVSARTRRHSKQTSQTSATLSLDLSVKEFAKALLSGKLYVHCNDELTNEEMSYLHYNTPTVMAFIAMDSITVEQAMQSPEWPQWQKAMQDELSKLASIDTWEQVRGLPPGRKALMYKWVLKKKYDIYNKLIYKARLTVKGCSQRPGVDFTDTFSPVAKLTAVRLILSLGVLLNFIFKQYDVQNAFPNAKLSDVEIYMISPVELQLDDNIFLKLNRALYGLKQSSREWNKLITNTLKNIGFHQLISESCIFSYNSNGMRLILALYVDDMIVGFAHPSHADWLFKQLSTHFIVKQNNLTRCLGFNVEHNRYRNTLPLSKDDYGLSLVKEYDHYISHISTQHTCLPDSVQLSRSQCPKNDEEKQVMAQLPFRQIMGKLNYYTCTLRADINFAVNYIKLR